MVKQSDVIALRHVDASVRIDDGGDRFDGGTILCGVVPAVDGVELESRMEPDDLQRGVDAPHVGDHDGRGGGIRADRVVLSGMDVSTVQGARDALRSQTLIDNRGERRDSDGQ